LPINAPATAPIAVFTPRSSAKAVVEIAALASTAIAIHFLLVMSDSCDFLRTQAHLLLLVHKYASA
jgi:hypothetical protein